MENYLPADEIKLVHSGNDYFEVVEKFIHESKQVLHIQTYIFLADSTGLRIIEAIRNAVARGVDVYVLADAFGCYPSGDLLAALKNAGAHARLFAPLFSNESIYFGRRLHHKVVVADKTVGIVGGINIADKYHGVNNEKPWLDYAVSVRGASCQYLHLLCEKFYHKRGPRTIRNWERDHKKGATGDLLVRYRRNDWLKRKDEIHRSYIHALVNAKHSVTIVASYFLPGYLFRKLLKEASRRGVKVTIILAGKLDSVSLRFAERYMYRFYVKNNILIYEWRNSVMHGKAMVMDEEWASIGSYNVNYLSRYLSVELNVDIASKRFAQDFSSHLRDICLNDCNFMNESPDIQKKSWTGRPGLWIAYYFHKLLQNIMMFGRRHREAQNLKQ